MLAKVFSLFSTIRNKGGFLKLLTIEKRLKRSKWFLPDKEAIHLSEHQINFLGKNGENYFHRLARKKPIMFIEKLSSANRLSRLFNKSPRLESLLANSSIRTIVKLMETPDNYGRYPLEYFLCYVTLDNIKDCSNLVNHHVNVSDIKSIINNQRTRRPDWLEVKMLIAETNQNQSCVDYLSVIWKQKTQEDFRECLKTDRGKEFVRVAANNFRYRGNYFDALCGVGIKQYTHGTSYDCGFLNDIDLRDKNEVKLYLMQSWLLLFNNRIVGANKFVHKVEFFTHKAVELGIDVVELKEKIISSFSIDKEWLGKLHKRMSKYYFWNSLEIINERCLIMQAVSLENRQTNTPIPLAL